ncbi:hypothetical protein QWY85_15725 [Neolewinella lacunae]|uniref:Uncharacterized protein n=1 Tax=Neolewinella lacunae TaxID=1517758 RepID=A0A923PP78_9BACT|nr:hypothetical protein [Neolewinella lacunae]MBC6994939.1 hypothetical protein [Neolewinella lacunae]MDN3636117.1 hypothetical protein [Neolewinella lacunae]
MKSFLSIFIFINSIQSIQSQVYADSISYGLEMANALSYVDSYDYFVSLEKRIPIGDSNRLIAVEIIIELSTEIEEYFRLREEYNESLIYSEKYLNF